MSESNGQQITLEELDTLAESLPTNTTDRETRREMVLALLRHSEAPAERVEVQQVVEQAVKPKLPRYVLQRRLNARVRDWLIAQATQPRRIARWLAWWINLPFRAASFVSVVASGRIETRIEDDIIYDADEAIAKRNAACDECDQRYVYVRLNGEQSEHCAACKCPPMRWSENGYRNTLAGWRCPLRKHPGPYPNDPQAQALKGLGYEENAVLSAVGGGCTGCGCGKK